MMAHTGLPESLPIGDAEPHGFEESIPDWVSMSSDDLDVTDPEPAGLDKRINQLRRSILAMKSKTVKLQWRLDHLCRVRSRLRERQRVSDGTATLKRHSRAKRIRESVSVAESSTAIEPQVLRARAESSGAAAGIVGDSSAEVWDLVSVGVSSTTASVPDFVGAPMTPPNTLARAHTADELAELELRGAASIL